MLSLKTVNTAWGILSRGEAHGHMPRGRTSTWQIGNYHLPVQNVSYDTGMKLYSKGFGPGLISICIFKDLIIKLESLAHLQ